MKSLGKFLSTTYKDSVESITSLYQDLVNNPFYTLNDRKPVFVTYYNINKDYSSVDPGSKLQYDNIGADTPMKWNRIYDFPIYGFSRIELSNEIGEFGVEANPIEGEAYILPNTITPYENDYFEVSHIKDSTWLFIIKDVQKDTLDNGSNAYKISYRIEYDDNSKIKDNIIHNFEAIEKSDGTNFISIARCEDVDIARKMDEYAVKLKKYFIELFYNQYVQTFIYEDLTDVRVYDPFMVEFIKRNRVLDNGEDSYVYVNHVIPVNKTFSLDYDHTMFRLFENLDREKAISYIHQTNIDDIRAYGTTFSARYEKYYQATWKRNDFRGHETMCLDEDILYHIMDHELFVDSNGVNSPSILWKNILVKHFYNEDITEEELVAIDDIQFVEAAPVFYLLPLLIYCLECRIDSILK